MKQYTPEQLQDNLDEILQEVQAGLPVEILRDGLAIAIIINQTKTTGTGLDEFFSDSQGRSRSVGEAYIAHLHRPISHHQHHHILSLIP